jgi:hypothetical protein
MVWRSSMECGTRAHLLCQGSDNPWLSLLGECPKWVVREIDKGRCFE